MDVRGWCGSDVYRPLTPPLSSRAGDRGYHKNSKGFDAKLSDARTTGSENRRNNCGWLWPGSQENKLQYGAFIRIKRATVPSVRTSASNHEQKVAVRLRYFLMNSAKTKAEKLEPGCSSDPFVLKRLLTTRLLTPSTSRDRATKAGIVNGRETALPVGADHTLPEVTWKCSRRRDPQGIE